MSTSSQGLFQIRIFCISNESDRTTYEMIKQSSIDDDGRYNILEEEGYWTKEGDRMITLKYMEIINPVERVERY